MQFTTLWSKQKAAIWSRKNGSQLFGSLKDWFTAITSHKNCFAAIWRYKKWFPAVWSPKNVVHDSLEEAKSG